MQAVTKQNLANFTEKLLENDKKIVDTIFSTGKNLYNYRTATIGYSLDNSGELTNDNSVISNAKQYFVSDFIPCDKYVGMYFCIAPSNGNVCFYDSSKAFISKVQNILYSNGRTIPSGACYLRFTAAKSNAELTTARVFSQKPTSAPDYDSYGTTLKESVIIPQTDSKLDKNQGITNADKYLKIGSDGNVIPSDASDDRLFIGETVTNDGKQDETISIGVEAGRNIQNGYIAIGHGAMANAEESVAGVDNGKYSTAIGHRALNKNTTGDHNTAIGWGAMESNTTGNGNTAVGEDAMCHTITGESNTCIGNRAYQKGAGSKNTVVGATAMYSSVTGKTPTGDSNTAIGYGAGSANGNSNYCTAVGFAAKHADDTNYAISIGAEARTQKDKQCVIGAYHSASIRPVETVLCGNIVVCGTDGMFRKLVFNTDGSISWTDVSSDYTS